MKILDIPKIKQKKYHCLPASMSMVFSYLKKPIDQEEIAKHLESYGKGFYLSSAIPYARSIGLRGRRVSSTIEGVVSYLEQDIPVIARIKHWDNCRAGHFIVIKGYDEKTFFINDPEDLRRKRLDYAELLKRWTVNNGYGNSVNRVAYFQNQKVLE